MNKGKVLAIVGLIFAIAGVTTACISLYLLTKRERPNNQYEIILKPDKYIIKDGERIVDSIPADKDRYLDSIFFRDNL